MLNIHKIRCLNAYDPYTTLGKKIVPEEKLKADLIKEFEFNDFSFEKKIPKKHFQKLPKEYKHLTFSEKEDLKLFHQKNYFVYGVVLLANNKFSFKRRARPLWGKDTRYTTSNLPIEE